VIFADGWVTFALAGAIELCSEYKLQFASCLVKDSGKRQAKA
jgi:hypothetical protein